VCIRLGCALTLEIGYVIVIFLVSIVVVRFGGLADLTDERGLTGEAGGG
jgi:hypothetical protein